MKISVPPTLQNAGNRARKPIVNSPEIAAHTTRKAELSGTWRRFPGRVAIRADRPLATCVVVVSSDESDEFFYLISFEEA
jgi:hypothetical protein